MVPLSIVVHLKDDPPLWSDVDGRKVIDAGTLAHVAIFDGGMESGLPSIMFRLGLPDGSTIIAQQTARHMATLGSMILAKYPNLLD